MTTVATDYEVVIGLEVHAQLLTRSKMFCGCSAEYSAAPPNTHVCPVCLGMPGVLPVINRRAVELTIMTALALDCEIPEQSKFDRKNYHYPDLMKGYQVSQYDLPLSRDGWLTIETEEGERRVGVTRVHLEEDTARLTHVDGPDGSFSLVDVNRSGVPLMEIVSEPDMRSPEEARLYLVKLRQVLRYAGVSLANMEEGNFRCDANVSLRPRGSSSLGVKVEVKNMNSFRSVQRALEYEVERQTRLLDGGEAVVQETRGWVESEGKTVSQRSKEYAHDYRYFPEPDLPPMQVNRELVSRLRAALPELPDEKRRRFEEAYGLTRYEAELLVESRARADYHEAAVAASGLRGDARLQRAKQVANWMLGDMARLQNAQNVDIEAVRIQPEQLGQLVAMVEGGQITGRSAKAVFERMWREGRSPHEIVAEEGLAQISGVDELRGIVERVIAASDRAVADYRAGKTEAVQFLVGQVMKQTKGRANPGTVRDLLLEILQNG